MDDILKSRLSFWKLKAEKYKDDAWIQFVIYWMILDAYITESSGKDSDAKKLIWLIETNNDLKKQLLESWKADKYKTFLDGLVGLSPIKDMRPTKKDGTEALVYLKNKEDFREVINFIYQIRCNTFHGAKDLTNEKDANLVDYANNLLRTPIQLWLSSTSS